ncbi:MAG: hypothetical protein IJD06_09325 [Clostridia bacterium]|nr:hypothetical protein [Clostridia bacterium]
MQYIPEADLRYILDKYNDVTGRSDTGKRFLCCDRTYDMSTGPDAHTLAEGLRAFLANLTDTDHAVIKAKAFAYVLENSIINVSPCDYFVGFHAMNRVVNKVLTGAWQAEIVREKISDAPRRKQLLEQQGAVKMWPDFDHSVPNYDYILPLGFVGMLEKVREAKANFGPMTEKQSAFFASIEIELNAVLSLLDRFIAFGEAHPNEKSGVVLPALRSLRTGAPQTTYEVLLFLYIYYVLSEHVEGLQVRSLSNLDRMLYPFYVKDRQAGVTEEQIRQYIAYFLMQYASIGNYFNQPVYLGGTEPDGSCVVNEMSYILLDVYDSLGIMNPKFQLKYGANTPRDFLEKALDMVRRGHNSIVFVSDETVISVLESVGCSHEDACRANISGCYEYSIPEGITHLGNFVNLAKMVEYALFNGCDMRSGESMGLSLGEAESFADFEEFFGAVTGYLCHTIDELTSVTGMYLPYYEEMNPMPLFSATRTTGLEMGCDAYARGAERFFDGMQLGALGTAADSLAMIYKYVYEKRQITMAELKEALRTDFADCPELRYTLRRDPDKYGNNRDLPDSLAVRLTEAAAAHVNGRPDGRRGGFWYAGTHVSTRYLDWKDATGATADGRIRGEELSKNATPAQGIAVSGAAAAILSLTKLDACKLLSDLPLDLSLVPASFRGEEGMAAMLSLLDVYRLRGGHAIQFNVLDAETLRQAQQNPQQYRDLQIRVCGWNAHFTSMNEKEQNAFIDAAESAQ